jgi:hypothetical protein
MGPDVDPSSSSLRSLQGGLSENEEEEEEEEEEEKLLAPSMGRTHLHQPIKGSGKMMMIGSSSSSSSSSPAEYPRWYAPRGYPRGYTTGLDPDESLTMDDEVERHLASLLEIEGEHTYIRYFTYTHRIH